jgi:CRISPR-associated protein Csd1
MLLERLKDYGESRIPPTPVMYKKTAIRWILDLDGTGKYLGMTDTSDQTKRNKRGKEFLAPHVLKTSGTKAKLLAENGEYVLGIPRQKSDFKKVAKVKRAHYAFKELISVAFDKIEEPEARKKIGAVVQFLSHLNLKDFVLPEGYDSSQVITFRVDGTLLVDLPSVRMFWKEYAKGSRDQGRADGKGKDLMQCLVCGEKKPAVRRLPFKIKLRSVGGQSSGNALISANVPAFWSYGLKESLIAPTCSECGELFSNAANALIEGDQTHIRTGPLMYVFWTKGEAGFSIASLLTDPQPGEVKALISSVYKGDEASTRIEATPFYATAFSASGARVAVRDWLDTTVGNVQKNLARYFRLQELVDWNGKDGKPIGINDLARTVILFSSRFSFQDLPPNVPKILLNVALKGGPLPMGLLYQAVKRNRLDLRVDMEKRRRWRIRPRIALIKMVLLSQPGTTVKEDAMTQIDTENQNPAYLCGRLFAVLESIQARAIPNAGATIVDRFFGTASSAPASVLGLLLSRAQAHLGKLRRERRGAYVALQQKLEEIQSKLSSFPKTLSLEGQGLFSLGYYHQRAHDRAAAAEYLQAKKDSDNDQDLNNSEGGENNE